MEKNWKAMNTTVTSHWVLMAQGVSYTIVQRINERDYHQHWKSSHQAAVLGTPVLSPSVMESGW